MFRLAACRDYAEGLEFEFIYHKRRTPAGLIIREIPDHPRMVRLSPGNNYDYIAERILNRPLLCGYDQVGTPKIITDNEGELLKSLDYDSFGNLIEDSLPKIFLPLGFACGLTDLDTGLVHFGYR